MQIAHKIELKPNNKQKTYFAKACGTARFAWNWAVAEWEKQYKEGEKPSGMELKISFEYIKKEIGKEISAVYVSGGSLRLYEAEKFFENSLGLKIKRFNFSNAFNFNGNISAQELELVMPELVVAAGLALD